MPEGLWPGASGLLKKMVSLPPHFFDDMASPDKIQQAKDHIAGLIQLGQEIHKALPYLDNLNQQLDWYGRVYDRIEDKRETLMAELSGPVAEITSWDYPTFNAGLASGSTAAMLTASTSTISMIEASPRTFHFLIQEYDKINPLRTQINEILRKLLAIDDKLYREFEEVRDCHTQWNLRYKSNSDLAKDARTFQEHFEGYLNKLRVPKTDWSTAKVPSWSWNKMTEEIGKKSPESKKALMLQKKIGEDIWIELTPVLKKTVEIPKDKMEELVRVC